MSFQHTEEGDTIEMMVLCTPPNASVYALEL